MAKRRSKKTKCPAARKSGFFLPFVLGAVTSFVVTKMASGAAAGQAMTVTNTTENVEAGA